MDILSFNAGMRAGLQKNAGFVDDLGAAWSGLKTNTQGTNPLAHPIDFVTKAYDGAKGGVYSHVANEKTKGLQDQGLAFNRDQYGAPMSLDFAGTAKNMGNQLGSSVGNFASKYKMPLLLGAGTLATGWLLRKLFKKTPQAPRYGAPQPYYGPPAYAAPQAIQKAGGANEQLMQMLFAQPNVSNEPSLPKQNPYNIYGGSPQASQLLANPAIKNYLTAMLTNTDSKLQ